MDAEHALTAAGLQNIALLFKLSSEKSISEIGSSSLHADYAPACDHLRKMMWEFGGIKSSGEKMYAVWKLLDTDGMLYFAGYKQVESKAIFVSTPEYIQILSSILEHIHSDHLKKIDDFCGALCSSITSIRSENIQNLD
jgi:hypothetical protein